MNNKVCPNCGEEYSSTYRTCPFCEEEEAIAHGTPIHRRGGKRLEKGKNSGGAGGVLLLVGLVVVIGVAAFFLLGDRIQNTMGIRDPTTVSGGGDSSKGGAASLARQDETDPSEGVTPSAGDDVGSGEPTPLALNFTNIRIEAGEKGLLSASGGTGGDVEWSTSNENIATVENGSVTGKAGGEATITATRGEESVSCTVTVLGEPYVSNLKLKLNKTDFTYYQKDGTIQMKVLRSDTNKEYDGAVTWASKNTSIVTISESGAVNWVGTGTTTVTATVEGQVLECIVRSH